MRKYLYTAMLALIALCLPLTAAAKDIPQLQGPVLYTSLGQSPDGKTLSVLGVRGNVEGEFIPLATAADVAGVKTVFITVGVSLKGFGAAGINLDTESKRIEEIIKVAKDNGIYVILAHIGGDGRRDNMTNLLLEKLGPDADAFLVYAPGNNDGWFTNMAGDKPLVLLEKTMDAASVLDAIKPAS